MILGIICDIGENKIAPDDNIRLLNNKPLIAYTIETTRLCTMLDDTIVSTDNTDVAATAFQIGAKVPFMRPASLATAQTPEWRVLLHAVETYEKQFGKEVSYIVNMGVNVPLKTSADIEGAIKMALLYPETDVVVTGYLSDANPYFNMVELTKKGYAEIVKKEEDAIILRKDAPPVFLLSGAARVVKKSALYNYSHWSQAVCRVYEMPHERALNVGEEMDSQLIQLWLDRNQSI